MLQLRSRNNKKIPPSEPLRRSTRKAKSLYLHSQIIGGRKKGMQSKKNAGRKKGKQSKSKKVISQKPKETTCQRKMLVLTIAQMRRTNLCSSYWLNGLRLSRKPNDERVMLFKEKKHINSSRELSGSLDRPKCCLCCGDGFTSTFIACEICGGNHFSSLMCLSSLCWGISGKGNVIICYRVNPHLTPKPSPILQFSP